MTSFISLGSDTYVSGQIQVDDIAAAKEAGVTDIIINRPEGEEMGQPANGDLAAAAEAAGINFHSIPMLPGQLTLDMVEASAKTYKAAVGKVWAFCKSGGRSAALWALASVKNGDISADQAISAAADGGYDLAGLKPLLDDLAS